MPITRREHTALAWPGDMFRRLLDTDWLDGTWLRIEEYRDDDTYVVRAEIPDIDPGKDVEISVERDVLHIHAERQEKSETAAKDMHRSEFRYGSFERTVGLPAGVDPDAVKASYTGGILTVKVPLPPAGKSGGTHVVPVSTGS